jgi:hypothetical protein
VCRSKYVEQLRNIEIKKFYYTVSSCWLFLYDLYYDARIHKLQENTVISVSILS